MEGDHEEGRGPVWVLYYFHGKEKETMNGRKITEDGARKRNLNALIPLLPLVEDKEYHFRMKYPDQKFGYVWHVMIIS